MTILNQRTRTLMREILPTRHMLFFVAASGFFYNGAFYLGAAFARQQPLSETAQVQTVNALHAAANQHKAQALLRVEEGLIHCGWQQAKNQQATSTHEPGPLFGAPDNAMNACLEAAGTKRAKVEKEYADETAAIQLIQDAAQEETAKSNTCTAAATGFSAFCMLLGVLVTRAARFTSPKQNKPGKKDTEL